MERIKRKSEMKKVFIKAGIPVARGRVARTVKEALALVEETGFPLIAKPDIGVGASKTYKIHNRAQLEDFFTNKPPADTIFEEFIQGKIETFDGLTDQNGKVIFCSSMRFNEGIMELVNEGLDIWYYTLRDVPADLADAGLKLVKAYRMRERFFHFEFFRKPDGSLSMLEVNMRPPGGLTTDMFNYANDIDIYREYANVVVHNTFEADVTRPYYCAYIGRRSNKPYRHSHTQILAAFPRQLTHHEPMSGVFAPALGDYGYVVRSPDLEEIKQIAAYLLEIQ
jgi:biotin carboxylase